LVDRIRTDAAWARAASDLAAASDHPVRLVILTDATSPGGRSRGQACAQLSRSARASTKGRVTAYAISMEAPEAAGGDTAGELVAYLLTQPGESADLAGAELVVTGDWLGIRSHPKPAGSVVYGGPVVPDWVDAALREIAGFPA
jgi:hypothetical protein